MLPCCVQYRVKLDGDISRVLSNGNLRIKYQYNIVSHTVIALKERWLTFDYILGGVLGHHLSKGKRTNAAKFHYINLIKLPVLLNTVICNNHTFRNKIVIFTVTACERHGVSKRNIVAPHYWPCVMGNYCFSSRCTVKVIANNFVHIQAVNSRLFID